MLAVQVGVVFVELAKSNFTYCVIQLGVHIYVCMFRGCDRSSCLRLGRVDLHGVGLLE